MTNGASSAVSNNLDPDSTGRVTLFLTRHGRTTANSMRLMQGWSDFPLTKEGREGVRRFGRGLRGTHFVSAWCGNLTRHYDTAREALDASGQKDLRIQVDPDLREDNFGSYEGRDEIETLTTVCNYMGYESRDQLREAKGRMISAYMQDAFHRLDLENPLGTDLAPEDRAETTEQVLTRMKRALTGIGEDALARGGGNVLVVSSGMSLQQFLITLGDDIDVPDMANTSVTKVAYANGRFSLAGPLASMEYFQAGGEE